MTVLPHINRLLSKRTVRYLISGGISYIVEISSFLCFYYITHMPSGFANASSLLFALLVNYLLAHHFVFMDYNGRIKRSLPRYALLFGFNLAASSVIVAVLVGHVGLKAYFVKPVVSAGFAAWTYFAYKRFVFLKTPADL